MVLRYNLVQVEITEYGARSKNVSRSQEGCIKRRRDQRRRESEDICIIAH